MSFFSSFCSFSLRLLRDQRGEVTIENPAMFPSEFAVDVMGAYYQSRLEYEEELKIATLLEMGLAIAQLVEYGERLRNAVNNRDDTIQDQVNFIGALRNLMYGQDLAAINRKFAVLGLEAPSNDHCRENVRYRWETARDGNAVDQMSKKLVDESIEGMPAGWAVHDGKLASALSLPVNGSYLSAAADRRKYDFIKAKVGLLHGAQRSAKALFNASMVLAEYDKAIGIYGGLADIFIQGFNSAGAALGTALGKLANAAGHGETNTASNSPGVRIGMGWGG